MRGKAWWLGTLVVAVMCGLPAARAEPAPEPAAAATGLTLVDDVVLSDDGRLHDLTLASAALRRDTKVRVLLPAGYDDPAEAATRYPMLLLLHGASGSSRDWTTATGIQDHVAGLPLIVVMPDGGSLGFYSDWLEGDQWETHHLDELVPYVDATYRTVGTRAGRAIAGLSMGGFGSMTYAARHPDRFVAAAAFSGAVAIADLGLAEATALQTLGLADDRRWGPYLTHAANWHGHNPPDLVANLRWTAIRLASGNGVACPGDRPEAGVIEAATGTMTLGLSTRLSLAGIPHSVELRPCGTHEWHYWDRDLAAWLPSLMDTFAHPPAAPVAFDYRSTEGTTSVWGWTFTAHRPAIEFLDLRAVSPAGLTATGSGLVDVVSPPVYEPGATYLLTSASAGVVTLPVPILPPLATLPPGAASGVAAVAGADGRLSFTLDLGPAHELHQYSPGATAAEALGAGSYFRTVTLSIAGAAPPVVAPEDTTTERSVATSHPTLPATGSPGPTWPLVAVAVVVALGLRRTAGA